MSASGMSNPGNSQLRLGKWKDKIPVVDANVR